MFMSAFFKKISQSHRCLAQYHAKNLCISLRFNNIYFLIRSPHLSLRPLTWEGYSFVLSPIKVLSIIQTGTSVLGQHHSQ